LAGFARKRLSDIVWRRVRDQEEDENSLDEENFDEEQYEPWPRDVAIDATREAGGSPDLKNAKTLRRFLLISVKLQATILG
jgi:hypothetical protein